MDAADGGGVVNPETIAEMKAAAEALAVSLNGDSDDHDDLWEVYEDTFGVSEVLALIAYVERLEAALERITECGCGSYSCPSPAIARAALAGEPS